MPEKLSVISLSYQMVEGLINNFKSNNWRAGQRTHTQICTHIHTHRIVILAAKVLHKHIILSCCLEIKHRGGHCAVLCRSLWIGSYRRRGTNKNTPSSCISPTHIQLYWQPLFCYNDIILIGPATASLHLLALGIVVGQRWVMLIRVVKGKEPLTWPGCQTASAVSGSLLSDTTHKNPQSVGAGLNNVYPLMLLAVKYSPERENGQRKILQNSWHQFTETGPNLSSQKTCLSALCWP